MLHKSRELAQCAFHSPLILFLVALALRLKGMHPSVFSGGEFQDHLAFGYEVGRIARSLVEGHGYSSPFLYTSGPTAWLGPVYPLLMYLCFKLFGVYTWGSACAILSLNSLFGALTCLVIYRIGRETLGDTVGLIAAWFFAAVPFEVGFSRWIWDTSLSALLLSLAFLVTLRMRHTARLRSWAFWGLLWGVIALSNPSLMSFLPVSAAWLWYQQRRQRPLRFMLAAAVVFAAVLSPWVIRNYWTFHKFIPLRDNVAMELWLGNHDGATGVIMMWDHPIWNDYEMAEFARMGEVPYLASKMQVVKEFVREHPARVAVLSLKRMLIFWAGVPEPGRIGPRMGIGMRHALYFLSSFIALWGLVRVLRRRQCGALLYAGMIVFYPAVYYITHNHARYRHPMEPIMCLLGAYLFCTTAHEQPSFLRRRRTASPEGATTLVNSTSSTGIDG